MMKMGGRMGRIMGRIGNGGLAVILAIRTNAMLL